IVTAISGLVDSTLGPLLAAGEEDLAQIPLAASRCQFQELSRIPGSSSVSSITCRALAAREARNQAALFAFEHLMRPATSQMRMLRGALALGCGWSQAEAVYRAVAGASMRWISSDDGKRRELTAADVSMVSDRHSYVLEALANLGVR